jgi:hypothetical protein
MTIGTTSISLATIIEQALRRCKKSPEVQTPDFIRAAKENLYFLLTGLHNDGIPLWVLDQGLLPIIKNKARYEMPIGTVDVFEVNRRRMTVLTSTETSVDLSYTSQFESSVSVRNVQITCDETTTLTMGIYVSDNGVDFTNTNETISVSVVENIPSWVMLDNIPSATYIKLTETALVSLPTLEFKWVQEYRDTPLYRMSRVDYSNLPNKDSAGGNSYQYYYDRKIVPQLILWPVPNDDSQVDALHYFRQREIADLEELSSTMELPKRWIEPIIWQLASTLSYILPDVDPAMIALLDKKAKENSISVGAEEIDNAPVFIGPDVGCYNA